LSDETTGGDVVPIDKSVTKKRRPKRTDIEPTEAQRAMIVASAYEMRCKGEDYVTIAKALKIKGGWIEAHRVVAEHYGELVAGIDKAKLREQEAGRLMALRAAIEPDVRRGEKWAIQADLNMSDQIADLMGLSDSGPAGSGGATAVQINISPPWGNEPPPLPPADIEYE
jgi:hypothetical protein